MYFSDEPMTAIYGESSASGSDCLHFTPDGAKFFTGPSVAIDRPPSVSGLEDGGWPPSVRPIEISRKTN